PFTWKPVRVQSEQWRNSSASDAPSSSRKYRGLRSKLFGPTTTHELCSASRLYSTPVQNVFPVITTPRAWSRWTFTFVSLITLPVIVTCPSRRSSVPASGVVGPLIRTFAEPGALRVCWIVLPVIATSAFVPPVLSTRMFAVGGPPLPWFASTSQPVTWRLRTSPPRTTTPPPSL